MPFDQQNFVTTETNPHDVFSLEGLIWWLERQEPDEGYDYLCNGFCLIGRYFRASGIRLPAFHGIGSESWIDADGERHPLAHELNEVANRQPWTYGGALKRARKLLAEQS